MLQTYCCKCEESQKSLESKELERIINSKESSQSQKEYQHIKLTHKK